MDWVTTLLTGGSVPEKKQPPGFLEGVVADVLEKTLGNFVRGLDKDHLTLSIWDGDVRLRDLELRTELIDALPLPVRVLGGSLGEVRISIPWRNLLGNEPMVISVDQVLLLVASRTGGTEEKANAEVGAEAAEKVDEALGAIEEQNEATQQMGPSLVDKLVHSLMQKLQVSIKNVHVRIQGEADTDIAGGIMLRSLKIDDLSEDAMYHMLGGRAAAGRGKTSRAEKEMYEMLSRKRVHLSGLSVYLDTAAGLEQDDMAAAAAAAEAAGAAGEVPPAAAATATNAAPPQLLPPHWEARMLEAISAPAGRSHVLGPADLTASAVFDLSGNVLKGTFDTPRFIFDLDVSSELSLSISHGQMDVLKELGGALGRAETRKRYESCDRPNSRVPVRPFEDVEERMLRGPNLAARRWWRYAKECVLFDWREEHGKTRWRDVVSKARVQEEYIRALEEEHTIRFTRDYHRRLSTRQSGGGGSGGGGGGDEYL